MRPGVILTALLIIAGSVTSAASQSWPSKPIRWIVPYPAGGGTDLVSRAIGAKLSDAIGQPVVVENRSGANTIIGTQLLAQAAPDGHTIGLITDAHSINAASGKQLPYDSDRDIVPIMHLLDVAFMLVVNADLVPMRTLPELIKHAKENPNWLTFGSLGPGSPHDVAMTWFKTVAGIDVQIVPYRGISPALQDVLAGHVKSMFIGVSVGEELIRAGKIRALAVTSGKRLASAPTVPTIAEQGYPDFEFLTWYALAAPRNTPESLIKTINTEINRTLGTPEVKQRIAAAGGELTGGTPENLASIIRRDVGKYRKIFEMTGYKPE